MLHANVEQLRCILIYISWYCKLPWSMYMVSPLIAIELKPELHLCTVVVDSFVYFAVCHHGRPLGK